MNIINRLNKYASGSDKIGIKELKLIIPQIIDDIDTTIGFTSEFPSPRKVAIKSKAMRHSSPSS
jgi:hypothetical protein